jgi:hypothetical protein
MQGAQKTSDKKEVSQQSHPVKPKIKQDRQVIEGTVSANQTVEGGGDAFRFDGYKAQILVPHRQSREEHVSLKDNRLTALDY